MSSENARRWVIFILSCLLFVLSQFYRASIAVITPELTADPGLDIKGLSLISATFFYAFAITQIPISMYLDSIGPRVAMTVLSMLAAAGAWVFAAGESLGALVVGRLLLGAGTACTLMGTLKLITMWFGPLRFATMSALVISIGTLGNMTATTPLVLMVQVAGWRPTFVVFAGIHLFLTVLFFLVVRDRPEDPSGGETPPPVSSEIREILETLKSLLKRRDYWIISLTTFCRYGIFAAVQSLWAGPYLMKVIGVSPVMAGNVILSMAIGLLVGSPVCGWLSDTVFQTRKGVMIAGLGGMGLSLSVLACLPLGAHPLLLWALFFAFSFFSGAGIIVYTHIKERMPLQYAGTAMTGVNFFTMIGVAVFLQGLGGLMQFLYPDESLSPHAFRAAFLFCSACLALTAILYSFTAETIGKRKHEGRQTTGEYGFS